MANGTLNLRGGNPAMRYFNPYGRNVSGRLSGILSDISSRKTAELNRDIATLKMGMLDEDRSRQALIQDMAQMVSLIDAGQTDQIAPLLQNRIESGGQLGKEMRHSQEMLRMAQAGEFDQLRKGGKSILDMAEGVGEYTDPAISREKTQASLLAAMKTTQFGADKLYKDEKGNLYTGTQGKNPISGDLEYLVSPVGDSPENYTGALSLVDASGRTSAERVQEATAEAGFEQSMDYAERAGGISEAVGIYKRIGELLKNPKVKVGRAWAMLPTLTAATQEIQTLGNDLGLNLIAAGKFGPLSEGEMQLAMDQSLPDETLGRTELSKWVETRGAAKAKLASYLRTLALKLANKDISREEIVNLISAPRGQADTQTDSVVDWNSL